MDQGSPRLAPISMVHLVSLEGAWRCVSGGSRGIRSVVVFDGFTWIRSLFCLCFVFVVCVFRLDPLDLRFYSSAAVVILVHWSYEALARQLPDCLLQQVVPGSDEGGAMMAARLRLASVLVVVARCST